MTLKFPTSSDKKLNFRRNLVKRYKLVGYYDEFFSKEVEGFAFAMEPKAKDDAWHPSGHCTPPVRELYYHALGNEPEEFSCSLLKTFGVGHYWHQLLQFATLQLGLCQPEAIERRGIVGWGPETPRDDAPPWLPYHWATGQGDLAPAQIPNHGEYLVDFKTMNSRDFMIADGGALPDWAAQKYEAQINIYMSFFDLDRGLIVGVQKDSPHNFCEIEYARNQPLIDAIYRKWEFISECIDIGEAPSGLDNDHFALTNYYRGPIV